MKTFIFAFLISFGAFAQEYRCKEAYEQRINKNFLARMKLGKGFEKAVIPIVLTDFFILKTSFTLAGSLVVSMPLSSAAFLGYAGWMRFKEVDLKSHVSAQRAIEEALLGKDEMIERNRLAHLKYQMDLAKEKLEDLNAKNVRRGEREVTLEEYLLLHPVKIYKGASYKSPISEIELKLNNRGDMNVSYQQIASVLREHSQDESFCGSGKPFGRRQLQKFVISQLGSLDQKGTSQE